MRFRSLLLHALVASFAFAGVARATPNEAVEFAAESYLEARGDRPMMAASAAGGPKGWLNARVMAWYPTLNGSGNDDGGGHFDLKEDLGLGDNELALVPQITVDFWIFGFRTDAFSVGYDGEGTITRTITIGGETFVIGEDVVSELKVKSFRSLGLISFFDAAYLRIAGIIGFNYYDYEATVTGAVTGTATSSGSLPFPVVGLLAQGRFSDILLEAEVSGFYIDYSDIEATAIDFTVSVAWNFLKFGEVRAGYRFVSIDGTIDDTSLEIRLDGFFLAVGVTF
ncbi:MAG: porin family protein [Planctomycetota bacterium]|jgi:hypothetical protein